MPVHTYYSVCVFYVVFCSYRSLTVIYTLSLHDALPILPRRPAPRTGPANRQRLPHHRLRGRARALADGAAAEALARSEEHTSELQSLRHLVCRLLLEKKKKIKE